MFYRVETKTLNKYNFIFGALTIGFFKFNLFIINMTVTVFLIKLITIGADTKKPYSKLRRFLLKTLCSIFGRIMIFCLGW